MHTMLLVLWYCVYYASFALPMYDSFSRLTDWVVVSCLGLWISLPCWTNKHFDYNLTLKWRCSQERGHIKFGPAPSNGTVFWLAPSCYATPYVWTCRGMYRVALVLQTMSQNVLMQPLEDKIHMHSCKCTWFMFVLYFFEGLYIYRFASGTVKTAGRRVEEMWEDDM